jgi:hypothetical protein
MAFYTWGLDALRVYVVDICHHTKGMHLLGKI